MLEGPGFQPFVDVGVGVGDEEDGSDEVAELVLVLVGFGGGEASLATDFFGLVV